MTKSSNQSATFFRRFPRIFSAEIFHHLTVNAELYFGDSLFWAVCESHHKKNTIFRFVKPNGPRTWKNLPVFPAGSNAAQTEQINVGHEPSLPAKRILTRPSLKGSPIYIQDEIIYSVRVAHI